MKKVLASVLAGSMVLGMASMASAATLKKTDNSKDYDFQIYAYEPDGEFKSSEKLVDVLDKATYDALTAYQDAYKALEKTSAANVARNANKALSAFDTFRKAVVRDSAVKGNSSLVSELNTALKSNKTTDKLAEEAEKNATAAPGVSSIAGKAAYTAALAIDTLEKGEALVAVLTDPDDIVDALAVLFNAVGNGEYTIANKDSFELFDNAGNEWKLYTYGEDDTKEVVIRLAVEYDEDFRVDVASGGVTVTRKRVRRDKANNLDVYDVTIKAAAGVRDFELDDYKVEFDLHDANLVFFIEGEVAYSDYRDVEPDERYIIKKSTHIDDHTDGSIFNFGEVIDEETRIVCNDYVDLLFKGNYGTDFENLRVMTDDIKEVEDFFQDYDIDYYDFIGTPKFAKDITVRVDADSDSYIYEFDKKTGDVVDITDECDYTSDGWTFKRKSLKTYVVLEEPYEGGNVRADKEPVDDEPTEPDDTDATGSKPNPGTGAMPF